MRNEVGRLARLERIVVGLLGPHVDPQKVPDHLREEVKDLLREVQSNDGAVCMHCNENFDHSPTCAMLIPSLAEGTPDPLKRVNLHLLPEHQEQNMLPEHVETIALTAKKRTLAFTVCQYEGVEVFPYKKADHPNGIDPKKLVPITVETDLKEGDEILVQSLFGGFDLMTARRDPKGVMRAMNENHIGLLSFGKDNRKCWICSGLINTAVFRET